jgi:hypothetical protein
MATLARLVLSLTAALVLVGHPATRIPAGVRTIDLHAPAAHVGVTDREKVGRIVGWIDRLQAVPRGRYACPAMVADPKTITLDFRDSAGRLLARARYRLEFGGRDLVSGPCNSVLLSVPGRRERPLLGGRFLVRVQRLLAVGLR